MLIELNMVPKVSIIVPIYNVEKHIEKCVISLFEQSLDGVEFIFIDDCSPDKSITILENCIKLYPQLASKISVLKHAKNKGLAAGRNTGLKIAKGDYIFHCDSDDWLEKNAMEKLYNYALQEELDMVWCDWFLSFDYNERYMSQSASDDPVAHVKTLLSGGIKYNVWNKLVKRSIYEDNNIIFPEGFNMGEDMTMIKVVASTKKIGHLSEGLYHYMQNNQSAYTKQYSKELLNQLKHNVDDTIGFLIKKIGNHWDKEIQFFKLNVKLPFLISNRIEDYKRWLDWYPEANVYIDENMFSSWRIKIIQKIALRRQFWLLKMYHYIFTRLVYGVIYK